MRHTQRSNPKTFLLLESDLCNNGIKEVRDKHTFCHMCFDQFALLQNQETLEHDIQTNNASIYIYAKNPYIHLESKC